MPLKMLLLLLSAVFGVAFPAILELIRALSKMSR
jgi:hypothetical protein